MPARRRITSPLLIISAREAQQPAVGRYDVRPPSLEMALNRPMRGFAVGEEEDFIVKSRGGDRIVAKESNECHSPPRRNLVEVRLVIKSYLDEGDGCSDL